MKLIVLIILCFTPIVCMAQEDNNDGLLGDFDGNGTEEYAFVRLNDCDDECGGKCETVIYFTDKNLKPVTISPAKSGTLYNLKDLNDDGGDEIGFYPNWCTSCWHPFYTYTLQKKEWKPLVNPIPTHCSQWEENKFPIEKDPKKKGYVIITSSKFVEDIITVRQSVKLR